MIRKEAIMKTAEMLTREYSKRFIENLLSGKAPFNFKVGGEEVKGLFTEPKIGADGAIREARFGGLKMTASYAFFGGAVEISVNLKNESKKNSEQITDIDFCDIELPDAEPYSMEWMRRRVLYSIGAPTSIYDYQPREADLARPDFLELCEEGGRASEHYMPYFNCSSCDKEGLIAAIGHSGNWRARFDNGDDCMKIRFTYPASFYLMPGESIDLPHVLIMPWKREDNGDRDLSDTFNLFRRIMRGNILPPELSRGYITLRSWGGDTQDIHKSKFENIKRFGIRSDAYGIDAGWYELDGNGVAGDWYMTLGDWREASSVHPDGLEWLAEKGREAGADGFWLWIELERAIPTSAAYKAHPEHYFGGYDPSLHEWDSKFYMLKMWEREAREYMKEILYPTIRKTGLTMFRVDFNINPSLHFTHNDEEGRSGITELKYYDGLYKFFAEMKHDFPNMIVDNCASGGTRLDYRMCRIGVPVNCRSDYFTIRGDHTIGQQAQTVALSRWLPVHGDSAYSCSIHMPVPKDTYADRSAYSCNFALCAFRGELTEAEGAMYKKIIDDAYAVREYMPLDFYPLTGYSLSPRDWCAFEAADYDGSRAMVMAFRRELSKAARQTYALSGLPDDLTYTVYDLDTKETKTATGKELAEGFEIEIDTPRESKIFIITRCN